MICLRIYGFEYGDVLNWFYSKSHTCTLIEHLRIYLNLGGGLLITVISNAETLIFHFKIK